MMSNDGLRSLARICISNSSYINVGGEQAASYFDVDQLYGDKWYEEGKPQARELFDRLIHAIQESSRAQKIDALAFIERDDGPLGLVSARQLISERSAMPVWVVRPRKRLHYSLVKGGVPTPGHAVAILNDVATTGDSIVEAAEALWSFGVQTPVAFSVVDLERGARQKLASMEIELQSICTMTELQTSTSK